MIDDWKQPGIRLRTATDQSLLRFRRNLRGQFAKGPTKREAIHELLRQDLQAPRSVARSMADPPPHIAPIPARRRRIDRRLQAAIGIAAIIAGVVVGTSLTLPPLALVAIANLAASVVP